MTLYLLCGLAFSGKSTLATAIAEALPAATVVSLDALNAARGLHGGDGIATAEWARTHAEALVQVETALKAGRTVVVDDTNCFRFLRDDYRAIAGRLGIPMVVIYLDIPLSEALARLRANESAPSRPRMRESILLELAAKFELPGPDEDVMVFRTTDEPRRWVFDKLRLGEALLPSEIFLAG